MNRQEAINALREGKKITHTYFDKHEYFFMECINPIRNPFKVQYVFEDGVTQSEKEFWDLRKDSFWDDGWEIFDDRKNN